MNDANPTTPAAPTPLPAPRVPVTVRPATAADLPFIDALQKRHTHMVGWMPLRQLEGKVAAGQVLVAESMQNDECRMMNEEQAGNQPPSPSSFSIHHSAFCISPSPLGYAIAADRYMKREDVGIVYQLNVAPGARRGLVGAALLRAVFARAAYGCRLFCCWCAQDIEANHFWEAMGFVPLAYRAGSRGKGRTHVFWQRRIRAGDTTTPYWFPSQTGGGSIREDRLVLPIPPGTHWADAKPVVLPGSVDAEEKARKALPGKAPRVQVLAPACPPRTSIASGGLRFAMPAAPPKEAAAKAKRGPKRKVKNDPKLVAAARELRDRWLEHVNAGGATLPSRGKYDVALPVEVIDAPPLALPRDVTPLLPAPAAA